MDRSLRNIAAKLRAKSKAGRLLFKSGLTLWRFLGRIAGMLAWPWVGVGAVWRASVKSENRVLVVWDTFAMPYSIGDMLVFQAGAMVLRETYGTSKVDVCIVSDQRGYKVDHAYMREVTAANRIKYCLALARLVQFNPFFGSLLVLDSYDQMTAYLADNAHRYVVWPETGAILTKEYLYYRLCDLCADHYSRTGRMIRLSSDQATKDWALAFLHRHAPDCLPVVVQLRSNPEIDTQRNSSVASWLDLFRYCQGRYPVKFIVICARDEMDSRLSDLANVVVAKHFGTSLEEDLALIECAAFYMGGASGVGVMAWFSDMPYSIVNWIHDQHHPDIFRAVERGNGYMRFVWANSHQRLVPEPETTEVLVREFERLFSATNWQDDGRVVSSSATGTLRLW